MKGWQPVYTVIVTSSWWHGVC